MFGNFSLKAWEVPLAQSSVAPEGSRMSNKDMDPTPPQDQVWSAFSFITMWVSDGFSPTTLQLAGAMISLGLSWQYALAAVALGNILISWACAANGWISAVLHTPFAVNIRSSFGFRFAYFAVITRLCLACVYTGTKSLTCGQALYQMLRAMAPSFTDFPNHLPANIGITSKIMISYFVFWCIQTPLCMISPNRLRYLFLAKSIIGPIAGITCCAWYAHRSGGYLYVGSTTLTGSNKAWVFMSCVNSAVGSYSTLSLNIGDFTRYAKRPRSQMAQVIVIPVCFIATAFMGIVIASGGYKVHNLSAIQFDVTRLMNNWSTDTPLERAALFFFAFAMMLSNLGSNISANTISAANDWTALFPKYLNIRRGSFLTSLIGCWCCVPWLILATASTFLSFLGGYTLLSAPIWAIMVTDYFIVKKQKVNLPALYDPKGIYMYNRFGTNWRVLAVLLIIVPISLPGLAKSIDKTISLPLGYTNFYKLSWLFGTVSTAILYPLVNYLFPHHGTLIAERVWDKEGGARPGFQQDDDEEKSIEKDLGVNTAVVPAI